uniref:Liver-expressed antimicrobial peptide 2 n=1 Tax=Myripristis murdjan TaxID=586833 RepID=A0A667Y5A9_9TELE
MQDKGFVSKRKAAAALCLVLLVLAQQVCAGPVAPLDQVQSDSERPVDSLGARAAQAPRRTARMTPLWRLMNSKPFGAYCQYNYECSTGLCREISPKLTST